MDIFEIATKEKYRFGSEKGNLTVEDVWDLPLTSKKGLSVDALAVKLNNDLEEGDIKSFVKANTIDIVKQTKLEILLHIIKVKTEEREAVKVAADKKLRKSELISILAEKENNDLRTNTSAEDIRKMIAEL